MDLLRGLVEGTHGEGGGDRRAAKNPKVAKLMDSDDIKVYLVTFERLMAAYEVPHSQRAFQLAPQLSGKAQLAYAALGGEAASDYKQLFNTLSKDIWVWVQEHKPKSSEEAAQLADDYIQAIRMNPPMYCTWR